jgi:hypothetical protein
MYVCGIYVYIYICTLRKRQREGVSTQTLSVLFSLRVYTYLHTRTRYAYVCVCVCKCVYTRREKRTERFCVCVCVCCVQICTCVGKEENDLSMAEQTRKPCSYVCVFVLTYVLYIHARVWSLYMYTYMHISHIKRTCIFKIHRTEAKSTREAFKAQIIALENELEAVRNNKAGCALCAGAEEALAGERKAKGLLEADLRMVNAKMCELQVHIHAYVYTDMINL